MHKNRNTIYFNIKQVAKQRRRAGMTSIQKQERKLFLRQMNGQRVARSAVTQEYNHSKSNHYNNLDFYDFGEYIADQRYEDMKFAIKQN